MKTAYNTRCDNPDPVSGFLGDFPESFPEDRLLATVRRADDFAEKLASPEETILVYDDMGGALPSGIRMRRRAGNGGCEFRRRRDAGVADLTGAWGGETASA